jgi:transposase
VWKRFWRLSQAGVFEAFFDAFTATSQTAHWVQMFDSTGVRAHVSAAGAKDSMGQRMAEPWLGLGSDHLHPEPGHERHRHDRVAC